MVFARSSSTCAREKFEYFYCLEAGSSTGKMTNTRSCLTVAGWADADILHWADVAAECQARVIQERSPTASCWSFGNPDRAETHRGEANQQAAEHNETVAKLMGRLDKVVRDAAPYFEQSPNVKRSSMRRTSRTSCMAEVITSFKSHLVFVKLFIA